MQAARERLAFGLGPVTVPGRGLVDAARHREAQPTFATAAYAEPRDWGYVGLMAFTAVLLLRPQDQLPILDPLHLAEVFAIAGIAPMVLHRFARHLPAFRITPETIGLMVLGGVMIATVPFSVWPSGALDVTINAYLKILLVFILMVNTLTTPKRIDRLVWLIVVCCGYIAGRAVFDYARGVNLIENDRLAGPVGGIFGNPNDLALNMVTFMPAAALFALSPRYSRSRRLVAAAAAALMLAVVILTKSRGGLVGLLAMLIGLVVLGRKIRRGFAVIAIISVLVALPFVPSSFWTRMLSIVDEQQDRAHYTGSREARRILMQEGIDTFIEFPFTGVGAGQFKTYNPPGRKEKWRETHNVLIQVAADLGIFGLLAFTFLIVRGLVVALRTRRMLTATRGRAGPEPRDAAISGDDRQALYQQTVAMTAGLIGWFVCAMFASVAYSWTFYYPLAIVAAMYELTRERLARSRTPTPQDAAFRTGRRARAIRHRVAGAA
jgi:O-antigen ligase